LWSGPTDQRMRPTTINIARNQYIRDLMVANGDAHKPIWISEAAWNAVPSEAEHPEPIEARYNYGQVTLEQQARYTPQFYQRAQEEWPWIGVINYWFFTRPSDRESNQSFYYFRMVEPDYSEAHPTFTPLPVYKAMRDHITSQKPTLYEGVHQVAGHWALETEPRARSIALSGALYDEVLETRRVTFIAHGTDVTLRWRGKGMIFVNGTQYSVTGDEWRRTTIHDSLTPQTVEFVVEAYDDFWLDAVIVRSRTYEKVFPLVAVGLVLLTMLLVAVGMSLWERRRAAR